MEKDDAAQPWTPSPTWIEVGRVAHQLQLDHGPGAYHYAAKQAQDATLNDSQEAAEFWRDVAAHVKPRGV